MELRRCGSSDLLLSKVGLGCWSFGGGEYWGRQDQNDVDEVVHSALDHGINYFDTAEMYNEGRSEISLGKSIKGIPRDKVIIGSKVSPDNCYTEILEEHCNQTLKRLDTDYIDIYMIHWPIHPHSLRHYTSDEKIINNPPVVNEAFNIMLKLQKAGKIRYIGISNFSRSRIVKDIPYNVNVTLNELPYNLLSRAIEFETLSHCENAGIGIIAYISLFQGILTGKYSSISDIPAMLRRTRHFDSAGNPKIRHREKGFEAEVQKALDDLRSLSDHSGNSMTRLATGWVVSNIAVTSSIIGARNLKQLKEIVDSVTKPLPSEIINELDIITLDLKLKMGNCLDYWENTKDDRTI
jgi:aryl-alcohol dehydrogenase-like predicted oxidoreductase